MCKRPGAQLNIDRSECVSGHQRKPTSTEVNGYGEAKAVFYNSTSRPVPTSLEETSCNCEGLQQLKKAAAMLKQRVAQPRPHIVDPRPVGWPREGELVEITLVSLSVPPYPASAKPEHQSTSTPCAQAKQLAAADPKPKNLAMSL